MLDLSIKHCLTCRCCYLLANVDASAFSPNEYATAHAIDAAFNASIWAATFDAPANEHAAARITTSIDADAAARITTSIDADAAARISTSIDADAAARITAPTHVNASSVDADVPAAPYASIWLSTSTYEHASSEPNVSTSHEQSASNG